MSKIHTVWLAVTRSPVQIICSLPLAPIPVPPWCHCGPQAQEQAHSLSIHMLLHGASLSSIKWAYYYYFYGVELKIRLWISPRAALCHLGMAIAACQLQSLSSGLIPVPSSDEHDSRDAVSIENIWWALAVIFGLFSWGIKRKIKY